MKEGLASWSKAGFKYLKSCLLKYKIWQVFCIKILQQQKRKCCLEAVSVAESHNELVWAYGNLFSYCLCKMFILLKQVRMGTINTNRMFQHFLYIHSGIFSWWSFLNQLCMKRSFFFPRVPFQLCAEMTAWELINSWLLILLPHFQAFKLPQLKGASPSFLLHVLFPSRLACCACSEALGWQNLSPSHHLTSCAC